MMSIKLYCTTSMQLADGKHLNILKEIRRINLKWRDITNLNEAESWRDCNEFTKLTKLQVINLILLLLEKTREDIH